MEKKVEHTGLLSAAEAGAMANDEPGSIVPIQMGPMRNIFFPRRLADYIPFPEKRALLRQGVVPQRNYAFGKPIVEEEGIEFADVEARTLDEPIQPTKTVRVTLDTMQVRLDLRAR